MASASIPSHKVIPGTGGSVVVDAFRYPHPGVKAYFLTHAHSDHYTGLSESWSAGPIYCSPVTARLVPHLTQVDPQYLRPLPLGQPCSVAGVEVTLVDANHCPGAVQLLFRLPPSGTRYLHTGDMRFSPAMMNCRHLAAWRGCEGLFLDTTYCHPKHTFPSQEDSVAYVVRTLGAMLEEDRAAGAGADVQQHVNPGLPTVGEAGLGAGTGAAPVASAATAAAVGEAVGGAEGDSSSGAELAVQDGAGGQQDGVEGGEGDGAGGGGPAGGPVAGGGVGGRGLEEWQGGRGGRAADGTSADAAVEDVRVGAGGSGGPFRRLYLVSTYVIGKERILLEIRQHCGVRIYVPETKLAVLSLLDLLPQQQLEDTFTTDPRVTPVHVVPWGTLGETWPFFRPNFVAMQRVAEAHGAPAVVGFCPTGWMYEMKRAAFPPPRSRGSLSVHLVPYSEHSSYTELREYVRWLRPQQVIPTVGVGGEDGDRARAAMLKHFRTLVDETASKARFLAGFTRGRPGGGGGGTMAAAASVTAAPTGVPDCQLVSPPSSVAAPAAASRRGARGRVTVLNNGQCGGGGECDVIVLDSSSEDEAEEKEAAEEEEGAPGKDELKEEEVSARVVGGPGDGNLKEEVEEEVVEEEEEEGWPPPYQQPQQQHPPLSPPPWGPDEPMGAACTAGGAGGGAGGDCGQGGEVPPAACNAGGSSGDNIREGGGSGGKGQKATGDDPSQSPERGSQPPQLLLSQPPPPEPFHSQPPPAPPPPPPPPPPLSALQQLLAVLGPAVSHQDVERLLAAARGDVAAAANAYFDGGLSRLGPHSAAIGSGGGGGRSNGGGGGARGRTPGSVIGGSTQASQGSQGLQQQGQQQGARRGAKRPRLAGPPAPGSATARGGGRGAGGDHHQRSIAAFFAPTRPTATAPAAPGLAASGQQRPPHQKLPQLQTSQDVTAGGADTSVQPGIKQEPNTAAPSPLGPMSPPTSRRHTQRDVPGSPGQAGGSGAPQAAPPPPPSVQFAVLLPSHGAVSARADGGDDANAAAAAAVSILRESAAPPHAVAHMLAPAGSEGGGGGGTEAHEGGGGDADVEDVTFDWLYDDGCLHDAPRAGGGQSSLALCPSRSPSPSVHPKSLTCDLEAGNLPAAKRPRRGVLQLPKYSTAATAAATLVTSPPPPSGPSASPPPPPSLPSPPPAPSQQPLHDLTATKALHPFFTSRTAGGGGGGGGSSSSRSAGRVKPPDGTRSGGLGRGGRSSSRGGGHKTPGSSSPPSLAHPVPRSVSPNGVDAKVEGQVRSALSLGPDSDNDPAAGDCQIAPPPAHPPAGMRQGGGGPASHADGHANGAQQSTSEAATDCDTGPNNNTRATAATITASGAVTQIPPPGPTASKSRTLTVAPRAPAPSSAATPSWEPARTAVLLPPAKYDPVRHACWPANSPTPYLHVALALAAIDSTPKRLAIADALTNMFRAVLAAAADPAGDLIAVLYLVTGRIAPEYNKLELNVGGATVGGALTSATGVSGARLKALYRQYGDLGDVALACRRTQSTLAPPPPLLAGRLLAQLRSLAGERGAGAARRRQTAVLGLLRACRDCEVKYLTRTLISNLRVGANWRSVLGPLGRAVLIHQRTIAATGAAKATRTKTAAATVAEGSTSAPLPTGASAAATAVGGGGPGGSCGGAGAAPSQPPPPSPPLPSKPDQDAAAAAVVGAYHLCPCFELLVPALLEGGVEGLKSRCVLTPGVPLKPMLARICEGVADGLRLLGPGTPLLAEYKYDGVRAQIHLMAGGQVRIFSRNCEDRTEAFPDVVALVRAAAGLGAGAGATPPPLPLPPPAPPAPQNSARQPQTGDRDGSGSRVSGGTVSCMLDAEVVAMEWLGEEAVGEVGGPAVGGAGAGGDVSGGEAAEGDVVASAPPPPYRLKAFQELATRARGQVEEHQVTVHVCIFVFDLLYWNGIPLLDRPLRQRRSLLPAALPAMAPGRVMLATARELQPLTPTPAAAPGGAPAPAPAAAAAAAAAAAPVRLWPAPGECGSRLTTSTADVASVTMTTAVTTASGAGAGAGAGYAPTSRTAGQDQSHGDQGPPDKVVVQVQVVDLAGESDEEDAQECAPPPPAAQPPPPAPLAGPPAPGCGTVSTAEEVVYEMLLQAISAGAEGLMLKRLDGAGSAYEPSRRSDAWIKIKRDYCEGLRDSVDVVPIGAWYGQGRKVKWFSPFLLAVYDPVSEQFQSLCRCMSGFSDEFYAAARERLGATIIPGPKPYYDTGERPSVWFEPTEVWELRGADLTLSPVHRAAAGRLHGERGVGMRFPRFIRSRPDKRPEDATGPEEIVALYTRQTRKVVPGRVGGGGGQRGGGRGSGDREGKERDGGRVARGEVDVEEEGSGGGGEVGERSEEGVGDCDGEEGGEGSSGVEAEGT